jgi:hypothetical protein
MNDEPDVINFDEAVAQAKQHIEAKKHHEMMLGELADRVEPKYGDRTLAKFAEEIGVDVADLNRWRSVYRAYKGKPPIEGTSPKFGVLQALQAHPKRDEIIKENPNLTTREARTYMRDWHAAHPEEQEKWQVGEARRWFAQAEKHAQEAIKYGFPAVAHLDPVILRQALDNPEQTEATFRAGARAFFKLIIEMKRGLRERERTPPPMFDDAPAEAAPADDDDAPPDDTAPGDPTPTKH